MMDCRDLTNDGLLDPLTADARTHLESCRSCQSRRTELQALTGELKALGATTPRAEDPALVRRILSRLPRRRIAARPSTGWAWMAGAAAALLIVLIVAVSTRDTRPPEPRVVHVPEARPSLDTILDPVPPRPQHVPEKPPPAPEAPKPLPETPVRPTPAPEVRPPAPAPTPAPAPVPAPPTPAPPPTVPQPPETKPARVFVTIAQVEGALELGDGKAARRIDRGAEWESGQTLRSTDRLSRLALPDGTRVTLRPRTELQVVAAQPPTLALERGEVYCEVTPGAGRRFLIVTPDAKVEVTGTQFGVKRTDHTEVVVTAGEVKVSNEKGEVAVPAGAGATARKATAPGKPRPVDADGMTAWRRAADPPETPRFRYAFEDGRLPYPWTTGKVAPGPGRGINRFCLEGSPGVDADLSRVDQRVPVVKGAMKVRFRYYATSADEITFQLGTIRVGDNFRYDVKPVVHGKWETVEAPLSEFYRMADRTSKLQEGDRFGWLNIAVWGAKGPVYFDDIELVEVQK